MHTPCNPFRPCLDNQFQTEKKWSLPHASATNRSHRPLPRPSLRDRVPPTRRARGRCANRSTRSCRPRCGAVGAHSTCSRRNRYARVARLGGGCGLWPVLFCRRASWTRGGLVAVQVANRGGWRLACVV